MLKDQATKEHICILSGDQHWNNTVNNRPTGYKHGKLNYLPHPRQPHAKPPVCQEMLRQCSNVVDVCMIWIFGNDVLNTQMYVKCVTMVLNGQVGSYASMISQSSTCMCNWRKLRYACSIVARATTNNHGRLQPTTSSLPGSPSRRTSRAACTAASPKRCSPTHGNCMDLHRQGGPQQLPCEQPWARSSQMQVWP